MSYRADTKQLFQGLYEASRQHAEANGIYTNMGKYADNEKKLLKGNTLLRGAELNPNMVRMESDKDVSADPITASTNAILHKNSELGAAIYQHLTEKGHSKEESAKIAIAYVQDNINSLAEFDENDPEFKDGKPTKFYKTFAKFQNIDKEGNIVVDTKQEKAVGMLEEDKFLASIDMKTEKLTNKGSWIENLVGNTLSLDWASLAWQNGSQTRKGMYEDWEMMGGGATGFGKVFLEVAGLGLSIGESILAAKLAAGTLGVAAPASAIAAANTINKASKVKRLIAGAAGGMTLMVGKGAYQDAVQNNAFAKKYFISNPLQKETYGNEYWASRVFDIATYAAGAVAGSVIEGKVFAGAAEAYNTSIRNSVAGAKIMARKMAMAPLKSVLLDTASDMAIDFAAHNAIAGIWGDETPVFTQSQRQMLDVGSITAMDVAKMAAQRLGAKGFSAVIRGASARKRNKLLKTAGKDLDEMAKDKDAVGMSAWFDHNFAPDKSIKNGLYKTAFRVGNWIQGNNLSNMDADIRQASANKRNLMDYMQSDNFNKNVFFKHYMAIEKSQNVFLESFMDIGGRIKPKAFNIVMEPLSYESAGMLAASTAMNSKRELFSDGESLQGYANYITKGINKDNVSLDNINMLRKRLFNHAMFVTIKNNEDKETLNNLVRDNLSATEQTELLQTFDKWRDITTPLEKVAELEIKDSDRQTPKELREFNDDLDKFAASDNYVNETMIQSATAAGKSLLEERDRSDTQENLFTKMFPDYGAELDVIAKDFANVLREPDQDGSTLMSRLQDGDKNSYFDLHQGLAGSINKLIPKYAKEVMTIVQTGASAKVRARQALVAIHKMHILADAFGYRAMEGVHEAKAILEAQTDKTSAEFLRRVGIDSAMLEEKAFAGERKYLTEENWVDTMFSDLVSRANSNLYAMNRLAILTTDPKLTEMINVKYYAIQKYMSLNDSEKAKTTMKEMVELYSSRLSATSGFHRAWEDEVTVEANGAKLEPHRAAEMNILTEDLLQDPGKYSPSWTVEDDTKPDRITSYKIADMIKYSVKKLMDHAMTKHSSKDRILGFIKDFSAKYGLDDLFTVEDVDGSVLRSMAGLASDTDTPSYSMKINFSENFAEKVEDSKATLSNFMKDSMIMMQKFSTISQLKANSDDMVPTFITYKGKLKDVTDMLNALGKALPQGFNVKASVEMIARIEGTFEDATQAVEGFLHKITPELYNNIKEEDRSTLAQALVRSARINNFLEETISFGRLQNEITTQAAPIRNVNALYDLGESRVMNITMTDAWLEATDDPIKKLLNNFNAVLLYGTGTGHTRRLSFVDGRNEADRVRFIRDKIVSMLTAENNKNNIDQYGLLIKQLTAMKDFPDKNNSTVLGGVTQMMTAIIEFREARYGAILKKFPEGFSNLPEDVQLPSTGTLIVKDIDRQLSELESVIKAIKPDADTSVLKQFDGLSHDINRLGDGGLEGIYDKLSTKTLGRLSEISSAENITSAISEVQRVRDTFAEAQAEVSRKIDDAIKTKAVSDDRLKDYEAKKIAILDEAYETILRPDYEAEAGKLGGKFSDIIVGIKKKLDDEMAGLNYTKEVLGIGTNDKGISAISNEREALEFAYSYLGYGEGMLTSEHYQKRGGIMPLRNRSDEVDPRLKRVIDNKKDGFNIVIATSRDIMGTSAGDGLGELPKELWYFFNAMDINGFNGKLTYSGAGNNQKLMFTSNSLSSEDGAKFMDIGTGATDSIKGNDIVLYLDSLKNISPEFLEASGFMEALTLSKNGNAFRVKWDDNEEFIRKYIMDLTKHSALSSRAQKLNYSPQIGIVDPMYNTIANLMTDRTINEFDENLGALETDILKTMNNPDAYNRLIDSKMRKMAKVPGILTVLAPMRKLNAAKDMVLLDGESIKANINGNRVNVPNRTNLTAEILLSSIVEFKSDAKGDDHVALIKAEQILSKVVSGDAELNTVDKDMVNSVLNILSKGDGGKFLMDEQGRYWTTLVRYPSQGKGQIAPFLIQGIRRGGVHKGVEVTPTYTQILQHTDYDGDRANILPVSTNMYQRMMDLQEEEGTISEHIVNKALDDLINAKQYDGLGVSADAADPNFDVNKSKAVGIEMATGSAISGLDGIPFYRYLFGNGLSKEVERLATEKTVQSVNKLLNEQYKDTKTVEPYQVGLDSSLSHKDVWSIFDNSKFSYAGSVEKTTANIGKAFLGSFRSMIMSNSYKVGKKNYKVAYATSGRDNARGRNYILILEQDSKGFGYSIKQIRTGKENEKFNSINLASFTNEVAKSTYVATVNEIADGLAKGGNLQDLLISRHDKLQFVDDGEFSMGNKSLRISNVEGFNVAVQNTSVDNAKGKGISYLYNKYYDGRASGLRAVIQTSINRLYASRMMPIDRITNNSGIVGVIGQLREGMKGERFLEASMRSESSTGLSSVIDRIGKGMESGNGDSMSFNDFQILTRNLAKKQLGDEGIVSFLNVATKYIGLIDDDRNRTDMPASIWRGIRMAEKFVKRFGVLKVDELEKVLTSSEETAKFVDANGMIIYKDKEGFSPLLELGRLSKGFNVLDNIFSGIGETMNFGIQKYTKALKSLDLLIPDSGINTPTKLHASIVRTVLSLNRNGALSGGQMLSVSDTDVEGTLRRAGIVAVQENIAMDTLASNLMFKLPFSEDIAQFKEVVRSEFNALPDHEKTQMGLKLREIKDGKETNLTPDRFVALADSYLGLLKAKNVKDIEIHKAQAILNGLMNHIDDNSQKVLITRTQGLTTDVTSLVQQSLDPAGKMKYNVDMLKEFFNVKKNRKFSLDAMYLSPNVTISDKTTTQYICGD